MKPSHVLFLSALIFCLPVVSAFGTDVAPTQAPSLESAPVAVAPILTPAPKSADSAVGQQSMRLGHVDVARIAAESETVKAEQVQIGELKKKLQGQIETKRKQLEKLQSSLEAKLKTLSPQQREVKAKEFQKKVEEFQKFGLNAEKELQAKQEELSEKLFKAVEKASIELGKAKGFALVVIKRELLYLANGVDAQDVTEDVIKKIDKK